MSKRKNSTSNSEPEYNINYSNISDDDYAELAVQNEICGSANTSITGKKVKNPYPVTMSLSDDTARNQMKADLFNRLYKLKCKRGIAKYNSTDEMSIVIDNYFHDCAEFGIRPTIRGLADALGTCYNSLNDWESGSRDKSLGSDCSVIIKKAKAFIAEFDEQMAVEGLDNPILFMFRAKNYYGMQDKKEISVTPQQQLETKSMDEIIKEIPEIPIDEEE